MPVPLRILLVVALVHGLAWSVATAPLNGPDEVAHAAYAQQLAETGNGPDKNTGTGAESTQMNVLMTRLNLTPIVGHLEGRPFWSRADAVSDAVKGLPRDDGSGPNPAGNYPPLYYAYAAVAYHLSPDTSLLARLWAMRVATVLLFVLAVAFAWLAASELFATTWKRVLATSLVALQPKLGFMAGVVNPDAMLVALGTLTLWLGLRVVRRGPAPGTAIALGLAAGAAAFCHPRGLYLPPFAVLAFALGWWRTRRDGAATLLRGVAVAIPIAAGVIAAVAWTRSHAGGAAYGSGSPVGGGFNVKEFLSYLWQFYLPKLESMAPKVGPDYGYRQVYIETYFGTFASLEVNYPLWVYSLLQLGAGLGLVALFGVAITHGGAVLRRWPEVVTAAVYFLGLIALLHIVSYGNLRGLGAAGDPVITGRYLLPAVAVFAAAVTWVVSYVPGRARAIVAGALVAGFVALDVSGIVIELVRFHG